MFSVISRFQCSNVWFSYLLFKTLHALYTVNNIKVHLDKEQIIDKTKYTQIDISIIMKCYLI